MECLARLVSTEFWGAHDAWELARLKASTKYVLRKLPLPPTVDVMRVCREGEIKQLSLCSVSTVPVRAKYIHTHELQNTNCVILGILHESNALTFALNMKYNINMEAKIHANNLQL